MASLKSTLPDPSTLPPGYLDEDKSYILVNAAIVFAALQTVFIGLFFISRIKNKTANGAEMWFMPLGYLFSMSLIVMTFIIVNYGGAGRHLEAVLLQDPNKTVIWFKLELVIEFAYVYAVTFPKLAILNLYLRIFTTTLHRRLTWCIGGVIVASCVIYNLVSFGICQPFAYNWDKSIEGGFCGNLLLAYQLASFPNIITDLAMLILPLPVIWNLHTDMAQKVGLTVTFLTGSLGIVTSFVRLYVFFTTDLFSDFTYLCIMTQTWTFIEPACYLIAATLPSLRPLSRAIMETAIMQSIRSRLLSYSRSRGRSTNNSGSGSGRSWGRGRNSRGTGLSNLNRSKIEADKYDAESGGKGPFSKLVDSSAKTPESSILSGEVDRISGDDKGIMVRKDLRVEVHDYPRDKTTRGTGTRRADWANKYDV